ncbi:hypothetical protein NLI96_g6529 [Meripilus lineatus]|uniref:DNA ligase n=1 Tax=Meripilus lineatus TaxID=2056292 RepID=A0AAD5YFU5_9APHY|nr:hypothetical protein NLI96_g6529 [Physisporinus lineatus]
MIPLGNKDPDAIRLLNWKRPTERDKSSGDFPTVLYEVVSKRSSIIEGTLSIEDLNDTLDLLAQNMGKSDIQLKVMQKIYNRTTPEEQRWIVRVILKDMNISVKETSVFSVFHPDAHDLFNTCSDLKKVAWELWDPKRRLNEEDKAIQLFRAFAPMLCKRPTHRLEDSVKEMQGSSFIIEEKLDGERMQLHKRGNEYFYCSRKGKDYTYLYGKHLGSGSLTPFIDEAFDSRIESIVLDGEMLVWDPVSERNLPFGTLKSAALDKSKKEHNPRPCFKVFDLLHLNGIDLLHKSLKFRKRNLRSCLTEVKGRLEFAIESEGKTAQDIRNKMEEIIASKGEGLVIKHPGSEYILNGRNKDWIKIKPEYMDNMGETVDVLVTLILDARGGCYGSGRRAGGVSTIICAVVDDRRQTDDDEDIKYTTFVRIGTGLSFADYVWVRQKPWKKYNPRDPPKFLQVSRKGTDDKPDLYLEPEDSFILKVKAAEIISTGFTMRFPRALMIRDDLSIDDCMTASAVLESVRSEKKRKMETDEGSDKKKKRKVTTKKITVLPEYQGLKLKDVKVETDLFAGMKFMVASDPKSRTGDEDKKQLLKLIHANGGSYTQVAANHPNLMVVYGGKTTPYDIKMIMNKGQYDIIKPAWITDSIQKGERVPMRQKYFFHATATRMDDGEYELEEEPEDVPSPSPPPQPTKPEIPIDTQLEQLDPALADWFHIDDEKLAAARSKEQTQKGGEDDSETQSETETEADSENEDVKKEDTDEWIDLRGVSETTTRATEEPDEDGDMVVVERPEPEETLGESSKMGEDEAAMEYDQDLIFKHLCFYLDSPDNARNNGMTIKAKNETLITKKCAPPALILHF